MENDLLTAEQLAGRLAVKPRTVQEWFRAGLIPGTRLTPKVIRYNLADVVTSLRDRQKSRTRVVDGDHASTAQKQGGHR